VEPFAILLVGGAAVSTYMAIRASAAERLASRCATALAAANAATSRAQAEASTAQARTDAALKESEQSRSHVETVSTFLVESFRKPEPSQALHEQTIPLFERALKSREAKLGRDHPDTLTSMKHVADSYQALCRHAEALAACGRAIALDPNDHDAWNHAASLWARSGDRAGYREHCHRMLDRFGRSTEPSVAERTAKA
jgi:tetratricopeptide (TPR) repeat protein